MGRGGFGLVGALALAGCYGGTSTDPEASSDASTSGSPETTDPGEAGPGSGTSGLDGGSSTSGPAQPDPGSSSESGIDGSTSGEPGGESNSTGEAALGCDALPNALLCADFEAGIIDPRIWNVEEDNGGSVTLEDGMLHVQLGSQDGGHGFLKTQPGTIFPVEGNAFFGRVRVRIVPLVPNFHCYMLAAEGQLDGSNARYRLDLNSGGRLNSRYTHASVPEHGGLRKFGPDALPNEWACIEWEYDGELNEMRYWLDGEHQGDMEVLTSEDPPWIAPPFDSFEFGYHTYQAPDVGDSFDVWFDDFVLSTQRVGC